jgi:hypothetical protein
MGNKFLLLLSFAFIFLAVSCSKKSDEILALLEEIKQQNIDLTTRVSSLQKTTDSLSLALKNTNQTFSGMDKKIDSIQIQLSLMAIQINDLNFQLTQANVNIADLQKKIAELQAKCQELLNQLILLTNKINIANGLIAFYSFDNNTGDSSGQNNHGVNNNAKFASDRFGAPLNAISFSSQNVEYVSSPAVINNVTNTFTISCWVNSLTEDKLLQEGITGSEGYGNQAVLHPAHGGSWGNAAQNAGVGLFVGKNQIAVVEHTHQYISAPLVYNSTFNGWHLITIVYENHIPKLYVDGVLAKTGKASAILNVRPSNGNDLNNGFGDYSSSGIGRAFSPSGNSAQFNGIIDEFRIYNRALTQSEITYLANN